jgi:hypothetical protein
MTRLALHTRPSVGQPMGPWCPGSAAANALADSRRKGVPLIIPTAGAGSGAERKKPWWIEDRRDRDDKEREHGQDVSSHVFVPAAYFTDACSHTSLLLRPCSPLLLRPRLPPRRRRPTTATSRPSLAPGRGSAMDVDKDDEPRGVKRKSAEDESRLPSAHSLGLVSLAGEGAREIA